MVLFISDLRYRRLAAEVRVVIWHVMRSLTWLREVLRVAPAQGRVSYETLRYRLLGHSG